MLDPKHLHSPWIFQKSREYTLFYLSFKWLPEWIWNFDFSSPKYSKHFSFHCFTRHIPFRFSSAIIRINLGFLNLQKLPIRMKLGDEQNYLQELGRDTSHASSKPWRASPLQISKKKKKKKKKKRKKDGFLCFLGVLGAQNLWSMYVLMMMMMRWCPFVPCGSPRPLVFPDRYLSLSLSLSLAFSLKCLSCSLHPPFSSLYIRSLTLLQPRMIWSTSIFNQMGGFEIRDLCTFF